ncbi:hypothetical protein [Desulfobulbus elongatus]|uniref:hypothetical protein n=1 Tax=Desulfobulbus elongatus TaxID=53332 RepID=UPI000480D81E|nr:hypothetical protein [Desulfobulbus elongatus]
MAARLIILVLLAMVPGLALGAWHRSIRVEWEYTAPGEPAVTGFRLYQGGTAACEFPGADTRTGDCTVTLARQVTAYTLTALFADGTESPHSVSYSVVYDAVAPVLRRVDIVTKP